MPISKSNDEHALTIGDVLPVAKARLRPISSSASLDAQLLLASVLACERVFVLAHPEHKLSSVQYADYMGLIERRIAGEPVAYLLGKRAFYDREFIVGPGVLIPRPETEHLLEVALDFVRTHPHAICVDVGTGSGALAVTLAANVPDATVYAIDISPDALAIASKNAVMHQADVHFLQGDLLAPLVKQGLQVHLVMANLPYIATDDLQTLEVRKYEPHLALDGGPDGLDLIRRLLVQLPAICANDGLILLEIGAEQGQAVYDLARLAFPNALVDVIRDYAGYDRVVRIYSKVR